MSIILTLLGDIPDPWSQTSSLTFRNSSQPEALGVWRRPTETTNFVDLTGLSIWHSQKRLIAEEEDGGEEEEFPIHKNRLTGQ